MANTVFLYIGSIVITLWGIGHLYPTKAIVRGFGDISRDNRLIITMSWINEGLTLIFIGLLVLIITILMDILNPVSILVIRAAAVFLVILSVVSLFTGVKTSIIPVKICPAVKTGCAILFILGSYLR
ncbi:hypothetical protein JXQ31_11975 [candidate division KSB1 bacterium]|nr:hypothetical protein [candidate division KSB1 bacterium]